MIIFIVVSKIDILMENVLIIDLSSINYYDFFGNVIQERRTIEKGCHKKAKVKNVASPV
jgi:hypothetical protein